MDRLCLWSSTQLAVAVLLHSLIVWTRASNLTSHSQYLCGKQYKKMFEERINRKTKTITKVFKDL